MPPLKLTIYGNGEEKELELPEQYAVRLKEEPLYRVVQDMNKDYQKSKEEEKKKNSEN